MHKFIYNVLLPACLCSCTSSDPNSELLTCQEIYGPADSTLFHLSGTYQGALPAPQTSLIAATLILNKDHTIYLHCEDKEVMDKTYSGTGIFTVEKDTLTIKLEGNQPIYYLIEKNKLNMLSRNKTAITGFSKDKLYFTKLMHS